MKRKPKISIIMPNYNSSSFLEETVDAIRNQTFTNWELIIVDDNSDLETKKILKKLKKNKKIKIFFLKKNKGDGYCRVYGVKKSNSKVVAFIDSDDIWKKNKLKLQFNYMKKNNLDFSYTSYVAFKEKENYYKEIIPPKMINFEIFIKNSSIATSSMMVNKKIIKQIKFSKSPNFEDYYLKCQLLKKIDYAYCLNKFLLKYRVRDKSLSKNKFRNLFWLWKINRTFNKLSYFESFSSVISISINSLIKYGFK